MSRAQIESLDHEGRGVTHVDGKVVFVEGALPGELVDLEVHTRKGSYDLALTRKVVVPSSSRVSPRCASFAVCGGCSMQHADPRMQVAAKQRVLEDSFARIGKIRPETMLAPIHGPAWAYRHRARFSSRYVEKYGGTLVGFRERRHSFVADMPACDIVPPRISAMLLPLRSLVDSLSIRERMPQIELAIGDDADALAFRVLEPLSAEDEHTLRAFGDAHGIRIYLQPRGPETVEAFHPPGREFLVYRLPDFELEFPFRPTEFTQVNHQVNRVLVRRAIALLEPQQGERIGDFFCGLGNFSLPIARRGAQVVGFEGNSALVERASNNAQHNGLERQCEFRFADLFKIDAAQWSKLGRFDKLLIDPPRDGAFDLVRAIGTKGPQRIVYVSCNPGTLARDAAQLVKLNGYRLVASGIVNMFPHTSHVESISLFEK